MTVKTSPQDDRSPLNGVHSQRNEQPASVANAYWKEFVKGLEHCILRMPSGGDDSAARWGSIAVPLKVTSKLSTFCKQHGLQPDAVFLTAWALVLRSYLGTEDACFGYIVSGGKATQANLEATGSSYPKTLVSSTRMADPESIHSALTAMQSKYSESLHYQGYSDVDIEYGFGSSESRLFNTLVFLNHRLTQGPFQRDGYSAQADRNHEEGKYDMILEIDNPTSPIITLCYKTSRFSAGHAVNIAHAFEKILMILLADPEQKMGGIDVLSESDWDQIQKWNGPLAPPLNLCVHQLLEQQAKLTPDATALCSWDGELSYQELDQMATRLAHHLVKEKGVRVESFVAFAFEKSLWAVIAMTAILKAGGICVPLNPTHPPSRLKDVMQDLGVQIVVCSPSLADRAGEGMKTIVVVGQSLVGQLPIIPGIPCPEVRPENAAFLVFTSGSTGKPKGIIQEHVAMATSLRDHCAAMLMSSESRTLQFSAYTFDTSISDTFGTLMRGGCVCLPSDHDRLNNLASAINSLRANLACLTPAVVDQLQPEDVPTLKALSVGGEPLTEDIVKRWADKVDLINIYGVTECIVWCVATRSIRLGDSPTNIGRATCGRTWITSSSDYHKLAPIGGVGELLIEGTNLARHYYQNPSKTREVFVQNPRWLVDKGSKELRRLYRTGDLVQYSLNGTINYIGRRDQQIKLAGQRIELGEIEHCMRQHLPKTTEVAASVIKPTNGAGRPLLVAYLCVKGNSGDGVLAAKGHFGDVISGLRLHLARSLPTYMIPSAFFPVQKMPLTSSCKLDRKKLEQMASEISLKSVAADKLERKGRGIPLTEMEKKLQELWVATLKVPPIAVDNDAHFLHFGDSIAAMKLVSLARKNGMLLTVADIFNAPILSDMAARVLLSSVSGDEELRPFTMLHDTGELAYTLHQTIIQCKSTRDAIQDIYPCSPLQEGLMALSLKFPGAYIAQNVLTLPTSIDIVRFKAAWEVTVRSNAILRTRIVQTKAAMLQAVLQEDIDWLSGDSLQSYLDEDRKKPIGLGDRLNRFALIKDEDCYRFVFTTHHSAYDGWSVPLIYNQVKQAYKNGTASSPPEFKTFLNYLVKSNRESLEGYWRSQLDDTNAPVFPITSSSVYRSQASSTAEHAIQFVRTANANITTSILIRAAWAILIGRHCNTDEVVVGTTLSGRNAPVAGIDELVGPTITTVPIRVSLGPSQRVEDFLRRLQSQATEMMPYEHFGLKNIRHLSRGAEAACGFQSLLVVHPQEEDRVDESIFGANAIPEDIEQIRTYTLTLQVWITSTGAKLTASYDSRVVDELYVRRLLRQLDHVVHQLCAQKPHLLLREVNVISPRDKLEVLEWNSRMPEYIDSCVHDLIAQRVLEDPGAPALCSWDGELSYSELDELSSRLAHYLVLLGVEPEVMVPLCFEKSLWTIVAIMGVMKAGGVFVTLDPTHPDLRLQGIVQDLNAKLLLCSVQYANRCSVFTESICIVSNSMIEGLPPSTGPPSVSVNSRNALYVQFTSGTTGKPKGSIIEHGTYCSAFNGHGKAIRMSRSSRVLQFASYNFDVCIQDIVSTLLAGGCICIPSESDRQNDIVGAINKLKANFAHLTPSFARLIPPEKVPSMKVLLLGGECMLDEDIKSWGSRLSLVNVYGPSECSVTCCVNQSPGANGSDACNIGRAVGCRLWLADPDNHDQLAPIGGLGELLVEGPILARRYLNQPEKTRETFIERPAWLKEDLSEHRWRVYKTGDLVRYSANGTILYVGRKDTQVKLRGQRIELAEVEHHVKRGLPTATDVVGEIIVALDGKDHPMLAAFVSFEKVYSELPLDITSITLQQGLAPSLLELEARLTQALPPFMIPSVYIPLRQMPLTMSRKIDRRKLKVMASELTMKQLAAYSISDGEKRAPSNGIERQMRDIWARVLNIEANSIGADDSFFRLGGDSIDAMKLVAITRGEGRSLTVADIFQHPRLSDMSLMAITLGKEAEESEVEPFTLIGAEEAANAIREDASVQCQISQALIEDIYPCTPLQQGLISLSMRVPGMEMAQNTFLLPENVDLSRFKAACEAVVRMNPVLRTRIFQTKSETLQVVTTEQVTWLSGKDLEAYLREDRRKIMQLGELLVRLAIIENPTKRTHHFCFTIHHGLYDGWSMRSIFQQVEHAYNGMAMTWPPGFNMFIKYLQAQGNTSESEAFWKSQFTGFTSGTFPDLPSVAYSPRADSFTRRQFLILRKAGSDITTPTIVQAAWAMIVAAYSGTNDVVFGSTVTGRNAPVLGIENIVGPTFTTIPFRVQLDYQQSISQYLLGLQRLSTAAIKFEQMGLQNIRHVSPEADLACGFQNILVVQPATDQNYQTSVLGLCEAADDMSTFNPYGIMVECRLGENNVTVNASFDKALIDEKQMCRIVAQFGHALRQLCLEDDKTLQDVDLLSPDDFKEIAQWNRESPEVVHQTVHQVIKSQVRTRPNAPSICAWDGDMTYRELDEVSSRFAYRLYTMGVAPDVMVPLCFDKSMWTIVAMLGVLKSGGAFVLLDPAHHPVDRLIDIVDDVTATVVVCGPQYAPLFESKVAHTVILSQLEADALPPNFDLAEDIANPENIVCVMFTSGSTGKPKGIVHDHQGLASSFDAFGPALFIDSNSRILQFAAYAFDACIGDMLAALMHGGCICIPSEHDRMNDISGAVRRLKANWALFTPSLARHLNPTDVPDLKTIVLGGESILQDDMDLWADKVLLLTGYGPAECSLCVSGELAEGKFRPPNLGWPLGCRTWVVDISDHNKLAPVGVTGQIIIEGPVVAARGYLNNVEKTRASFIDYPGWLEEELPPCCPRMFKTGDLGRYNSDGTLHFLGRQDAQIKLRGQRIELGEVEFHLRKALAAKSLLAEAAVGMISTEGTTNSILAAFLCLDEDLYINSLPAETSPDIEDFLSSLLSDLTATLSQTLPTYMVPSALIPVQAMPLTTSGKLNRRELSRIGSQLSKVQLASYTRSRRNRRAPSTEMEKKICFLWAKCLGVEPEVISADDGFVRLGGDSIQAMRLVALAREEGISLVVADIFKKPTLSDLAQSSRSVVCSVNPNLDAFALLGSELRELSIRKTVCEQCKVHLDAIEDIYPCTPLQEGLMSLSVIRSGAYVAYNVFELPPTLDLHRFQEAWNLTFRTNAILRTRIVQVHGAMLQTVIKEDLKWQSATGLQTQLDKERNVPMHFGDPLNRFALIRDEVSRKNHLVWSSHHSTYDGQSVSLILKQVGGLYRGHSVQKPVEFNSFIKYLMEAESRSEAYWRGYCSNGRPSTFPSLPSPGYQPHATRFTELDVPLERKANSAITTSTIIRAAWAMLLGFYCSDPQYVAIGTVLAGRSVPVPGVEAIVGPTLTTVPVVIKIDHTQTVTGFLEQVQDDWLEMIPHEHFGVQNIARLNEDTKAACGFQNLLVIQPVEDYEVGEGGVMGRWLDSGDSSNFHTYGMTLRCKLHDHGFDIAAGFDHHVIEPNQVDRILHQFKHILQQLCFEEPSQTLADIEVISQEDKKQLMAWNSTMPASADSCVHHMIAEWAQNQPSKPAVTSWDGDLTFGELNIMSARLALHLTYLGVGPKAFVALCFEKSVWTIVSMLAVMRAGGTFVPLDPSHPVGRLQAIVHDVGAKLVLCSSQYANLFDKTMCAVLRINEAGMKNLTAVADIKMPYTTPQNPAYCLFTSGTTGKPKGVVIEHASLCTAAKAQAEALLIGPSSRVLQFASYSFDASILEILTTLTAGGCVCVLSQEDRQNTSAITAAMTRMLVNWALLTPSFVGVISTDSLPHLKTLVLGGEPLEQIHIDAWADQVRLINAYGPTECSVVTTANSNIQVTTDPSNIGRAVGNVCWIVDAANHDRLAPVGALGELVVEGPILARGYLRNPEKEKAVFIEGPAFIGEGRKRRYKTGDLVRYNSDGTISYVGRKDNQVKLRGQRFEVEEVEHHIVAHPSVKHCVVLIPKSGPWKQHLLAVISLREIPAASVAKPRDSLRLVSASWDKITRGVSEHLFESLPPHMIPTMWIVVDDIPLSSSTKLNRSLVVEYVTTMDDETYRQAQRLLEGEPEINTWSESEKQLRGVWSRVLNIPESEIGKNSTFERLGGDSITAMQITARCRAENIPLTVKDILWCKTISKLAPHIKTVANTCTTASTLEAPIDQQMSTFELSPVQQMFFEMMPEGDNRFDECIMVKCNKDIPIQRLNQMIETMVARHSMLRARFKQNDGRWEQIITNNISGSYHLEVQDSTDPAVVRQAIMHGRSRLNIRDGPILVAEYFRDGVNQPSIFLTAHHLVMDLMSWRIILRDMEQLMHSGTLSTQTSLSFQAWSRLQSEYARKHLHPAQAFPFEVPASDYGYWNMTDQSNRLEDSVVETFALDSQISARLLGDCNTPLQTRPVELFLSALIHSFSKSFGDRGPPALFNVGHGREPFDDKIDISGTVGWFTTMCPVHVDVEPGHNIVDVIHQAKELRQRVAGNGWAYFASRYLHPDGFNSFGKHSPKEIIFNYTGMYQQLERGDALFHHLPSPLGEYPRRERLALFEVVADASHGDVSFKFTFNRLMKHQDRIRSWINKFRETLSETVVQLSKMRTGDTLGDSPLISTLSPSSSFWSF